MNRSKKFFWSPGTVFNSLKSLNPLWSSLEFNKKRMIFFSKSFSVRPSIKIDQVEVMMIHYLCEWMRYAVFGPTVGNDWSILRLAVLSNRRRLLLWSSWLETFQFLVTCRGCLKSDLRPLPSSGFDSENTLILHKSKQSIETLQKVLPVDHLDTEDREGNRRSLCPFYSKPLQYECLSGPLGHWGHLMCIDITL